MKKILKVENQVKYNKDGSVKDTDTPHDLSDYALDELCQLVTYKAKSISKEFHNSDNDKASIRVLEMEYILEEIKNRVLFSAI